MQWKYSSRFGLLKTCFVRNDKIIFSGRKNTMQSESPTQKNKNIKCGINGG